MSLHCLLPSFIRDWSLFDGLSSCAATDHSNIHLLFSNNAIGSEPVRAQNMPGYFFYMYNWLLGVSASQISWIQPRKMQKSLLEKEGYKKPAKSDNQLQFMNEEAAKIDLLV